KDIIRNLNNDTITFLFGSRKKGKHVAYRLVNARNFHTHYDDAENEYRYTDNELHYASNIVELLSTLKLFTELGIEEDYVLKAIKNNRYLPSIISNSKSELHLA